MSKPNNTQAPSCPIQPQVFFKRMDGDLEKTEGIIPENDNQQIKLPLEDKNQDLSGASFLLKLIVHKTPLCEISPPFVCQNEGGKYEIKPLAIRSKAQNFTTFRHEIMIRRYRKRKTLYTSEPSNNVSLACVSGNRLVITTVGIVSQKSHFFLFKKNRHDVSLFESDGKILIPDIPQLNTLPDFIENLVDISKLPNISAYESPEKDYSGLKLEDGEGIILKSDPFSGKAIMATREGKALFDLNFVKNLSRYVIDPKPGSMVWFGSLNDPKKQSSTSFKFIAKDVYLDPVGMIR